MSTTPAARTPLPRLSPQELTELRDRLAAEHSDLAARGVKLDLTRGKPSSDQLDLSDGMLRLPTRHTDASGTDVRNYGGLQGLAELRTIFAELLGVETEQLVAGGNSSLTMMRDCLVDLLLFGGVDSPRPWSQEEKVTFVCPVPGYDRHFTLLESLGIDMVTVSMHDDGPDAEAVAALVAQDPSIKGMWIVPTYSNPAGAVCSQEVASRLVGMETAAPDFRSSGTTRTPYIRLSARLRLPTTFSRWQPRPDTPTVRSCSRRRPRSLSPALV